MSTYAISLSQVLCPHVPYVPCVHWGHVTISPLHSAYLNSASLYYPMFLYIWLCPPYSPSLSHPINSWIPKDTEWAMMSDFVILTCYITMIMVMFRDVNSRPIGILNSWLNYTICTANGPIDTGLQHTSSCLYWNECKGSKFWTSFIHFYREHISVTFWHNINIPNSNLTIGFTTNK